MGRPDEGPAPVATPAPLCSNGGGSPREGPAGRAGGRGRRRCARTCQRPRRPTDAAGTVISRAVRSERRTRGRGERRGPPSTAGTARTPAFPHRTPARRPAFGSRRTPPNAGAAPRPQLPGGPCRTPARRPAFSSPADPAECRSRAPSSVPRRTPERRPCPGFPAYSAERPRSAPPSVPRRIPAYAGAGRVPGSPANAGATTVPLGFPADPAEPAHGAVRSVPGGSRREPCRTVRCPHVPASGIAAATSFPLAAALSSASRSRSSRG